MWVELILLTSNFPMGMTLVTKITISQNARNEIQFNMPVSQVNTDWRRLGLGVNDTIWVNKKKSQPCSRVGLKQTFSG